MSINKKRRKRSGFFIKLFAIVASLAAIVFGVYFALDKLIVPKYFKTYGIGNMHDLVAMVKTLYNAPDEDDIIKNGYLSSDLISATKKFKDANFPFTESGEIDYMLLSSGGGRDGLIEGEYKFTDREIAAILDQMLVSESGVLASNLPNIKYIDTININLLEIIIDPIVVGKDINGANIYATDKAKVSFTCKIDTSAVRTQMAKAMDTPLFLLNMIIPETLYITVDYNMEKNWLGEWESDDGYMAVNGRTSKDSKILLDLLVDFVFPEEDEMTVDILRSEFKNIIMIGLDVFGDVSVYVDNDSTLSKGIKLTV